MIAESARIFTQTFNKPQKKQSKSIQPSFIKLKTPSRIDEIESKVSHKEIKPPKIERSYINESNMSKLNCNQSKGSSIINPSVYNKYSPRILKN